MRASFLVSLRVPVQLDNYRRILVTEPTRDGELSTPALTMKGTLTRTQPSKGALMSTEIYLLTARRPGTRPLAR
jgi:hypothetical protein